jgi:TPR repeat protein
MQWYHKAADLGDAQAMFQIGWSYCYGEGVEQNYREAMKWFIKAADLGNDNAMYNIGLLHGRALGVHRNFARARQWFQKAADLGNLEAMTHTGYLYEHGYGVEKNLDTAIDWWKKAADLGNQDGYGYLLILATKENAHALYEFGDLYMKGHCTSRSYDSAIRCWRRAAALGNKDAIEALKAHSESRIEQ